MIQQNKHVHTTKLKCFFCRKEKMGQKVMLEIFLASTL